MFLFLLSFADSVIHFGKLHVCGLNRCDWEQHPREHCLILWYLLRGGSRIIFRRGVLQCNHKILGIFLKNICRKQRLQVGEFTPCTSPPRIRPCCYGRSADDFFFFFLQTEKLLSFRERGKQWNSSSQKII